MKLLWLVEMRSNATCIAVRIGKCLSAVCRTVFGLKQKDASSVFAFNSAAVYVIREALAKREGLEFNASKSVCRSRFDL